MSKKSMKNVDLMNLGGGSAVDQVEHLLDMIMEVSCNTNGCKAQMKIIRAMEDALQVMTEAYIPCFGCDCIPDDARPSFCGVIKS